MKQPNIGMLVIIMALAIGTATLFVYCYFGKMATESYEKMSSCLYDCNWVGLPPKLQKHFVIMIANAQQPLYYHGFGMMVLNLESFTKVQNENLKWHWSVNFIDTHYLYQKFLSLQMIRLVFSSFMMFKTLTTD